MTVAADVIAAARRVTDLNRASWKRDAAAAEYPTLAEVDAADRALAAVLEEYDARPMVTGSGTVDAMLRRLADLTDPADGAALSDSEAGTITDAADLLLERLGLEAVRLTGDVARWQAAEARQRRDAGEQARRHAEEVKRLELVITALAPHRLAAGLEPGYAGQVRISDHVLARAAGVIVELLDADVGGEASLVVRFAR